MTIRKLKYKDLDNFFLKEIYPLKINVNIGLTDDQRNDVNETLKTLYADSFMLMVKTLDYHWNIKGKLLKYLREMTMGQYQELFSSLTTISKRITTLGFDVPASLYQILHETTLMEKNSNLSPIALIADLIADNENIAKFIRNKITYVQGAKDETSVKILRERLETHETNAWELRSLIEK